MVGETRSGKSWGSLSAAYSLTRPENLLRIGVDPIKPRFSPIKHLRFDPGGFLAAMDQGYPKGSAFVWDDVGKGGSSRDWQKTANKHMGHVLQTCGYRNYFVILTVPDSGFIDKRVRKLIHFTFMFTGRHLKAGSEAIPYWVKNSPWKEEPYRIHPRVWVDGERYEIDKVLFKRPPQTIINEYQWMEKKAKDKVFTTARKEIAKTEAAES